jgi:hypothetical protein
VARALLPAVVALATLAAAGCAGDGHPEPKDTIKGMFGAIRTSDSTFLRMHIDLESAAADVREDLSLPATTDSAGIVRAPGEQLLGALTGEGALKTRWLQDQIVLGESWVRGDTALVEVSFIDRLTHMQYYNKMRLEFRGDHWVVTRFKTL